MSNEVGEATKIVAYDLPSESLKYLTPEQKNKVRSIRITCTRLLHELGVQATESVILVAPSKINQIENVIAKVNQLYHRIGGLEMTPEIVAIPITQVQQQQFNELARRRVLERIDEGINRITILLNNIATITDEAIRKKMKKNLQETKTEYNTIKSMCEELGIRDVNFDYLISLIDQALGKL
jgi:hypothetical protein